MEGEYMVDSGLIFSDIAMKPGYAHVGAWRDDDGLVTVAYLGIFPKQTAPLTVHVGGAQQSAQSVANALFAGLVKNAQ
jgi:hypothetical protein